MSASKKSFTGLMIMIMCCLFYSAPVMAAESDTSVFTLSRSVAVALEKSIALDSADRAIEKAGHDKNKAFKGFLPTLSGTYSYTRLDEAPTTKVPIYYVVNTGLGVLPVRSLDPIDYEVGTEDNYQAKVTLTQPIFTGYKLLSAYELAKLGIDAAKVDKETERLDIILRAKEAYFGILQAEKAVEVANQAIKQFEAQLNVAQNFYKVGMTTKNQVLEAEVNLAEAVQGKIRAENFLSLAKASFNTLLRRAIDAPVQVEDILVYKPFGHDFQYCLDQAGQLRPEIKAVLQKIEMAKEQIRLSRAGYYPNIMLTANHTWKGDTWMVDGSDFLDDHTSWDVTLLLSWEFWNWLQPRDAVRSSKADLMRVFNALTELKDGIQLEVKKNFLSLKEAEKQIVVTEKAIERAEENYRMSEERYKAQVGTSTEVINASTLLTSARRNYYDALYNYNLAWATLERAMGLGRDSI